MLQRTVLSQNICLSGCSRRKFLFSCRANSSATVRRKPNFSSFTFFFRFLEVTFQKSIGLCSFQVQRYDYLSNIRLSGTRVCYSFNKKYENLRKYCFLPVKKFISNTKSFHLALVRMFRNNSSITKKRVEGNTSISVYLLPEKFFTWLRVVKIVPRQC